MEPAQFPNQRYRSPDELAILVGVHHNTVLRWLRDGVVFKDGTRRYPEHLRTPGGYRVREDHFFMWLGAVSADRQRKPRPDEPAVSAVSKRRVAAALRAAGF